MLAGNLQVWRDHDGAARQLGPFMRLDAPEPSADARLLARNVFDSGGRWVAISEMINFGALTEAEAVDVLVLLRELTAWGIKVDWRLKAVERMSWRDLWHLLPPSQVDEPDGPPDPTLEFWQRQFRFGLCVMRRGPGIIEVRDRRPGRLRVSHFTSPAHFEAIERLEQGAPARSIAPGVLAEFEAARVVLALGNLRLWLPCRVLRLPLSPNPFW